MTLPQGLYFVGKALKAEASLASITFSQLLGKGTGGSAVAVATACGMSGKEQAQVLDMFRKPGGRKVSREATHFGSDDNRSGTANGRHVKNSSFTTGKFRR